MATPRYRLREGFFDGRQIHKAGAEIDWAGTPCRTFEPLNAEAEAAVAAYNASKSWDILPNKLQAQDKESSRQIGIGVPRSWL
jgi:hypothetical protein